jgi:predicted small metal-binding protein
MGLTLLCSDLDPKSSCPYVARGETMEELQADLTQHAKTVHSYTDEQLNDPKMVEAVKAAVKQE